MLGVFEKNPQKKLAKLSTQYKNLNLASIRPRRSIRQEKGNAILEKAYSILNNPEEETSFVLFNTNSYDVEHGHNGYTKTNKPHKVFGIEASPQRVYDSLSFKLDWEAFLGGGLLFPRYSNGDFRLFVSSREEDPFMTHCMLCAQGNVSFKNYLEQSPRGGMLEQLQVQRDDFAWRGDILVPVSSKRSLEYLTKEIAQAQNFLEKSPEPYKAEKALTKLDEFLTQHMKKINY